MLSYFNDKVNTEKKSPVIESKRLSNVVNLYYYKVAFKCSVYVTTIVCNFSFKNYDI